ncbi:Reverse transcriptase zinc-binding domain [Macleaya cordata]|uniref:Reverse transcriptase zinc-binding domain n=1 Tax=Macleaya cordata TaxID=56857 RepID=A0A200Q5B2_MACCD|nr:Reverse transcriptase zinc-binding domain [Macleaya cordata]
MFNIIAWNIRGLRSRERRIKIKQCLKVWKPKILILTETKLVQVTDKIVKEIWGRGEMGWTSLDATGLSGGVLIIWRKETVEVEDVVIGPLYLKFPALYKASAVQNKPVAEFNTGVGVNNCWNLGISRRLYDPEVNEVVSLLSILENVVLTEDPDELWWRENNSGVFSVKNCYDMISKTNDIPNFPSRKYWSSLWPNRVGFFLWLAGQEHILTLDNLQKRGWSLPNRCYLCETMSESTNHLLIHCKYSMKLWSYFFGEVNMVWSPPNSVYVLLEKWNSKDLSNEGKVLWRILPAAICWCIWKERNAIAFEGIKKEINQLLMDIKIQVSLWAKMNSVFKSIPCERIVSRWKDFIFNPP